MDINIPKIELNKEIEDALRLMEDTNDSIFITGRAGTGKSTLLQYFRGVTKKNVAVIAPTGVAALNVLGQTIHSFFNFYPGITVEQIKQASGSGKKIYKNINAIIIDEISMVRADLLDCVDVFLRMNGPDKDLPFGGIQMIFVGDLYQLPPVVPSDEEAIFKSYYKGPYFFNAKVFEDSSDSLFKNSMFHLVELKKIYRQKDEQFIKILDNARMGKVTKRQLAAINKRVDREFDAPLDDFYISLTSTNYIADRINASKLAKIQKEPHKFYGVIKGEFPKGYMPTSEILTLKEGSQIMMLNNDMNKRWVNGDVGKIIEIGDESIIVELSNGRSEVVAPCQWNRIRYFYNESKGCIDSENVGSFTQYPIKLAWAVTIHKGQGKTFDKVIINFGNGTFASGQSYVALSRCASLEGLVLKTPLEGRHIFADERVKEFMRKFSDGKMPLRF